MAHGTWRLILNPSVRGDAREIRQGVYPEKHGKAYDKAIRRADLR